MAVSRVLNSPDLRLGLQEAVHFIPRPVGQRAFGNRLDCTRSVGSMGIRVRSHDGVPSFAGSDRPPSYV